MKQKFLLVDDDYEDAHIFRETLENVDPDILCYYALHGQDAWDKLESQEIAIPDIVFLDMKMPVMNGREFLELLRNDERYESIPVIIYSDLKPDASLLAYSEVYHYPKAQGLEALKSMLREAMLLSGKKAQRPPVC
ncbi:response regulator [Flavitalea sp. BT771]|uniref:response regulator n=1 Tax=Flavitalea sp. BT771 TaxID=3063329 RepID=UPI0026E3093C|nr:response regulator [Flavitalea sp. BT771]MDO6434323.1 response regulator [Flavitalea sp. BT771]MDV6223223.1 response regulator [Flavitalea sp. BT771]